jgi:aquaporin NIP
MMENRLKKCAAEFIGTCALVFCGTASIEISEQFSPSLGFIITPLVFGLVIMAMVYAVGHISGAHFNPAVTLGFTIAKRFPLKELGWYWLAQLLGAVLGSYLMKILFLPQGIVGVTTPNTLILNAFFLEVVFTFFLMFVIMSVATDHKAQKMMAGVAIGGTVALDAFIGGPLTGASMNPARSFGPALVFVEWSFHWIYWVAPIIGASIAALTYERIR